MTTIQLTPRPPDPTPPGPSSSGEPIAFVEAGHHFKLTSDADLDALAEQASVPLSVIAQVTRRCNFDCDFCSETLQIPDPTLEELDDIRRNLDGVQRVFLSGGEPLLRPDFLDVGGDVRRVHHRRADQRPPAAQGSPATWPARSPSSTSAWKGHAPPPTGSGATTTRSWPGHTSLCATICRCRSPRSCSAVVLRSTLHALPYTCQIADALGAGKLKLIHPIRKGNGLMLSEDEFISLEESAQLFARLTELKAIHDWSPAIRMTTWTPETEGYSILVYPDGQTWAWPVYDREDKVGYLGNLHQEPISELWKRYPFKRNHFRKYLGKSIHVTT